MNASTKISRGFGSLMKPCFLIAASEVALEIAEERGWVSVWSGLGRRVGMQWERDKDALVFEFFGVVMDIAYVVKVKFPGNPTCVAPPASAEVHIKGPENKGFEWEERTYDVTQAGNTLKLTRKGK